MAREIYPNMDAIYISDALCRCHVCMKQLSDKRFPEHCQAITSLLPSNKQSAGCMLETAC